MNKIISANINGFIFSVDEKAYDHLRQYLDSIRQKVKNEEVMTDIENRIAELFDYKIKNGSQAILMKDVEEIIGQIGSPEQFGSEEQEEEKSQRTENTNFQRRKYRRLYRNEDDKMIGGVCSGLAAYFGVDPMLVRVAFALSFFAFGTGFLLYIFLMVIVPKAVTPSEKLEMMGEPVDFNNLGKTIEKDIKDAYDRYKPEVKTGFERFLEIAVKIGGIVLFIFVLSIIIPTGFGVFASIGLVSWFLPVISSYIFISQTQALIILIGLILFLLVPLVSVTYKIIQFLFKTRPMHRALSITLSSLWFIGFCLLAYSTYNTASQFSNSTSVSSNDTIINKGGTLVIRAKNTGGDADFEFRSGGVNYTHFQSEDDLREFLDDKIGRNIELSIVRSYTDKPVVSIIKRSNGESRRAAFLNSENISYHYELKDSIITLDDFFRLDRQSLWRNQRVKVVIAIPTSQKFILDRSCETIFDEDTIERGERHTDEDSVYDKTLEVNDRGVFTGYIQRK